MISFLVKPDIFDGHDLDAILIDWMDTEDMQDHGAHILTSWASAPEKFSCQWNIALALLSVFGSTYLCEQVFSHMKHVLSPGRSRLTTEHSEVCLQLKVTNYRSLMTVSVFEMLMWLLCYDTYSRYSTVLAPRHGAICL